MKQERAAPIVECSPAVRLHALVSPLSRGGTTFVGGGTSVVRTSGRFRAPSTENESSFVRIGEYLQIQSTWPENGRRVQPEE